MKKTENELVTNRKACMTRDRWKELKQREKAENFETFDIGDKPVAHVCPSWIRTINWMERQIKALSFGLKRFKSNESVRTENFWMQQFTEFVN